MADGVSFVHQRHVLSQILLVVVVVVVVVVVAAVQVFMSWIILNAGHHYTELCDALRQNGTLSNHVHISTFNLVTPYGKMEL